MPGISTTYLLPAILLNPALILHLINTFVSHAVPPPSTISHSPHPFMESLGPIPGSTPYFDVHADDQFCWRYTAVMVVLQIFAFGKVSDNRAARKAARAARQEREKIRKEKLEKLAEDKKSDIKTNGHTLSPDGTCDVREQTPVANGKANGTMNGTINGTASKQKIDSDGEGSSIETSEEEMMI